MVQLLIVFGIMLATVFFLLVILTANYLLNPKYKLGFRRRVFSTTFVIVIALVFVVAGWFGIVGIGPAVQGAKDKVRQLGLLFQRGGSPAYDVVVLGESLRALLPPWLQPVQGLIPY